MDVLVNLFDPGAFPPRWTRGTWTAGHAWLYIVCDLLTVGRAERCEVAFVHTGNSA